MFVSSSELGYKMGLCRWAHSFNSIFTLAANGVMGLTSVKAPGFGDERGVEAGGLSGGLTGRWAGSPWGALLLEGECVSPHTSLGMKVGRWIVGNPHSSQTCLLR